MYRNSATVGQPTATERCIGPVLLHTVTAAPRINAASCSMLVAGARVASLQPPHTASASASSPGPQVTTGFTPSCTNALAASTKVSGFTRR